MPACQLADCGADLNFVPIHSIHEQTIVHLVNQLRVLLDLHASDRHELSAIINRSAESA